MMAMGLMCTTTANAQVSITPSATTVQTLDQGATYTFDRYEDYYVSPSFFSKSADGSYLFKAISGNYLIEPCVNSSVSYKYLQVRLCDADGKLATLQSDGTGAIYLIGNGIGLPTVAANQVGWNAGNGISMAQKSSKHFELTGVVGKEFGNTIKFQFYGQNNWWPKLCGSDGQTYHISTNSDLIGIGTGKAVDGHDDGTLYYKKDVSSLSGDTLTISLDCSAGIANIVMTTTLKAPVTTGISKPTASKCVTETWYSIDGKRLSAEPKSNGIYIHNGRKIVK